MRDTHQSEDVGFVDVADLVGRHVLGGRHFTEDAGVVDEDVQVADPRAQHLDRRVDRRVVGHVQLDEVGAEPVGGLASVLGVPGSNSDRLARLDESARDLVAEAPVAAGYQCGGHVVSLLCASSERVVPQKRSPGAPVG